MVPQKLFRGISKKVFACLFVELEQEITFGKEEKWPFEVNSLGGNLRHQLQGGEARVEEVVPVLAHLMAASQSSTELNVLKSGMERSSSGWEGLGRARESERERERQRDRERDRERERERDGG